MKQSGKCLAQTPKLFGHAPKPCKTTAKPHPNCLAQTPKLFGFVSKLFGPTPKLFGLLWPNIAKLFGKQSQKYMPDHSGRRGRRGAPAGSHRGSRGVPSRAEQIPGSAKYVGVRQRLAGIVSFAFHCTVFEIAILQSMVCFSFPTLCICPLTS